MARKDIVVIGASAGGMEALQQVVAGLPKDFAAAVFVVWHLPPGLKSVLPRVLSKAGPLAAENATDGQEFEPGRIYIAPSDHHMLVEDGFIRVAHGPRENRFRPAIDPLFRSAAYVYGPRVIGVVLTGALNDGTAGLWTIKLRGGTAVVQDPADALHPSMPTNALGNVDVDHKAHLADIGPLLGRLALEQAPPARKLSIEQQRLVESEIRIAEAYSDVSMEIFQKSELSPFTCPECRGVLAKVDGSNILRYRCHTGHAFTAETLLESLTGQVENRLVESVRTLDELVMLLNHIGGHLEKNGRADLAQRFFQRAKATDEQAAPLRDASQTYEPAA
jgi:two-component system chemotaxis response regulator CheB